MVSDEGISNESLPCHMIGYVNPCVDCPLDNCPYSNDGYPPESMR
jgi:hypothetical protein